MPYPLQFRPNQKCSIFSEISGTLDTDVDIQLFKPKLVCRFNQLPQDRFTIATSGGVLQRFALQSDALAAVLSGPNRWDSVGLHFLLLSEDPTASPWYITDAVLWDSPDAEKIVSGYMVKKRVSVAERSTTPLPTGGATPDLTVPILEAGIRYSFDYPQLEDRWFLVYLPVGYTLHWRQYSQGPGGAGPLQAKFYSRCPPSLLLVVDSGTTGQTILNTFTTYVGSLYWLELLNPSASQVFRGSFALERFVNQGAQ